MVQNHRGRNSTNAPSSTTVAMRWRVIGQSLLPASLSLRAAQSCTAATHVMTMSSRLGHLCSVVRLTCLQHQLVTHIVGSGSLIRVLQCLLTQRFRPQRRSSQALLSRLLRPGTQEARLSYANPSARQPSSDMGCVGFKVAYGLEATNSASLSLSGPQSKPSTRTTHHHTPEP